MHNALMKMFPTAHIGDWVLRDDGDGPYIAEWHRPEPQPTPEDLAALATGVAVDVSKLARIEALLNEKRVTRVQAQTVLVAVEALATAKGIPLTTLYTVNKTYRMAKDLETAIIAIEKE